VESGFPVIPEPPLDHDYSSMTTDRRGTTTSTSTRNRIALAAIAGLGAAATIVAPAVVISQESHSSASIQAESKCPEWMCRPTIPPQTKTQPPPPPGTGSGGCPTWLCGTSGNHNEVLTRTTL
jgi:hypothetical protein